MKYTLALSILSAVACSSPTDSQVIDAVDELGQSYQTYLAPQRGPDTEFGTQSGQQALACTLSNPAQTCVIPATKRIQWFVKANVGSTATDRSLVKNRVNEFISAITAAGLTIDCNNPDSWCFVESTEGAAGNTLSILANGTGTGSLCTSGGTTNAEAYVCISTTVNSLTEDAGVVGNYVRRSAATLNVDIGDIGTHAANPVARGFGTRNLVFNGMLKVMGIGGQGVSNARCVSRPVDDGAFSSNCIIQSTEICALNGFTEFNDTTHYGNRQLNCGY